MFSSKLGEIYLRQLVLSRLRVVTTLFPITGLWFIYNSNMQDMTLRLTLDQGVMEIRVPLMCTVVVWNDVVAVGPPTFSHNRA